MRFLILPAVGLCVAGFAGSRALAAAEPPAQPPLAGLSFLVGSWQATGAGDPGRATGEFDFEWAAGRSALVRRNRAVTGAGLHEDVMLVFARPDGTLHALYADNEGHVIDYDVAVDADRRRAVFESPGPGVRFRLWYQAAEDDSLATGFQVARPDSPDFTTYLEGNAHRAQR